MKNKIFGICAIGICAALTVISAYIQIPFFIPITLQSLAIMLICGIFGLKIGLLSTLIYILIGVAGLPVFSGGQAGISALGGISGGFIIGFIPMAVIVGVASDVLKKRRNGSFLLRFVFMLVGNIALYACGIVFYCILYVGDSGASLYSLATLLVLPYLLPDIIKTRIAAYLSKRLSFLNSINSN